MTVSVLANLTVVVPTMNRQRFIVPQIDHWLGSGAEIHIWDGSNESHAEIVGTRVSQKVRYEWRPTSLVDRLNCALQKVDTEFCMMSQEEDFSLKSAVELCVRDLISDSGLVASTGVEAFFAVVGGHLRLIPSMPVGMNSLRARKNTQNASERIADHFNPFTPTHYYAICRTENLKKAVACIPQIQVSWASFSEFVIELCMVLQGPCRVNNVLRNLTRSIFDDDRNKTSSPYVSSTKKWLENDQFEDERSLAIEELSSNLVRQGLGNRVHVESALGALLDWEVGARQSDVVLRGNQSLSITSRLKTVLPAIALDLAIQFRNVGVRQLSWNRVLQGAQLLHSWYGTEFDETEIRELSRRLF